MVMLNRVFSITLMLLLLFNMGGCGKTEQTSEEIKNVDDSIGIIAGDSANDSDVSQEQKPAEDQDGIESEQHFDENAETPEIPEVAEVAISFSYTRMGGHASNQMAIWVEDEGGNLIKTVFVTNFTAGRRGYRNREMSLSAWVLAADPEGISDAGIDAITSATPSTGELTYIWNMTDEGGQRVPDGRYTIKLEGTLFWESNVLYSAVLDTKFSIGEQEVMEVRSEPDNSENGDMIENVRVNVVRSKY